jgi:translation initiation factor IF-3
MENFSISNPNKIGLARPSKKKFDTKGIRIGLKTDTHDLGFKKVQSEKFLKKGHKVKIEIILKGREKMQRDLAKTTLEEFLKTIQFPYKFEQEVKKHPSGFNTIITPE